MVGGGVMRLLFSLSFQGEYRQTFNPPLKAYFYINRTEWNLEKGET